jgi:hypothetical protein
MTARCAARHGKTLKGRIGREQQQVERDLLLCGAAGRTGGAWPTVPILVELLVRLHQLLRREARQLLFYDLAVEAG